ncbi:MAG: hypothetical protein GY793_03630 [Proteobacteria bacterium]|nr:hypothetical protein [Pseudomonadota bacterium]
MSKIILRVITFISLNFLALIFSSVSLQSTIAGPHSVAIWTVIVLLLIFILYSFFALMEPIKRRIYIMLGIFATIILITLTSDSIELAGDIDLCLDLSGRWNYELNKCEHSRASF